MSKATVSAFIVACNEEANIERCLRSVSWCDEIVVIDSGSKDRTLDICHQHNARVIERPWPGFVEQKRFGLSQCTGDWVLNIDADEEVSAGLRAELEAIAAQPVSDEGVRGYELPRMVFHLGQWWDKGGWWPEYRLRFCLRSKTSWGGSDPHEKALVDGPTKRLAGCLNHYTYADLADQVRSINRLSSSGAQTMFLRGRSAGLPALVLHPFGRFFKFFILKRGFLEGFPGFIVAVMEAFAAFIKYAKLWELQRNSEKERK